MDGEAKRKKQLADARALQREFMASGTHRGEGSGGGGGGGGGRKASGRGPCAGGGGQNYGRINSHAMPPRRPPLSARSPAVNRAGAGYGAPVAASTPQRALASQVPPPPRLFASHAPAAGNRLFMAAVPTAVPAAQVAAQPSVRPSVPAAPAAAPAQAPAGPSARLSVPTAPIVSPVQSSSRPSIQSSAQNPAPVAPVPFPQVQAPALTADLASASPASVGLARFNFSMGSMRLNNTDSIPANSSQGVFHPNPHPEASAPVAPSREVETDGPVIMYYQDEAPRAVARLPISQPDSAASHPPFGAQQDNSPVTFYYQNENARPESRGAVPASDFPGPPAVTYYQEEYVGRQNTASTVNFLQHQAVRPVSNPAVTHKTGHDSEECSLMDIDDDSEMTGYPVLFPDDTDKKCTCCREHPTLTGLGTSRWADPVVSVCEAGMFSNVVGKETDPTYIGCPVHNPQTSRVPLTLIHGANITSGSQSRALTPTATAFTPAFGGPRPTLALPMASAPPTLEPTMVTAAPNLAPPIHPVDVFQFQSGRLGASSKPSNEEGPWLL